MVTRHPDFDVHDCPTCAKLDRVRMLGGELARMAWTDTDHGALPLPTLFLADALERLAAALERAPSELERREYFHAYRNAAHALQANADMEATRLQLQLQSILRPLVMVALLVLGACSSSSEGSDSDPSCDEGSETDAGALEPDATIRTEPDASDVDAGAVECIELHPQTEPVPALYRPWGKCEGEITANAEASTPWREHPETGLCTFTLEWSEPTCDVPRLAADEPRCSASYSAKLEALCTSTLGGVRALGSYFEGGPLVAFCAPKLPVCADE
jgi:hypothetical protein